MHKWIKSLWPKQIKKGWEAKQLWESATRLRKANIHDRSYLRVLSGVFCLSSNKLTSFKGSGSCYKAWVNSPWVTTGIQGRALLCHQFLVAHTVASSSAVPRQDGTVGPDKERPVGPDWQHIAGRLVEKVIQEKCRQTRWWRGHSVHAVLGLTVMRAASNLMRDKQVAKRIQGKKPYKRVVREGGCTLRIP